MRSTSRCARFPGKYGPKYAPPSFRSRRVTKTFGNRSPMRQLDVWIRLVVAQQDVEARLPLLDQVVLKRQRLALVVDCDVLDVDRLAHQRSSLRVPELVRSPGSTNAPASAGSSPSRHRSPRPRRSCTSSSRAASGACEFSPTNPYNPKCKVARRRTAWSSSVRKI